MTKKGCLVFRLTAALCVAGALVAPAAAQEQKKQIPQDDKLYCEWRQLVAGRMAAGRMMGIHSDQLKELARDTFTSPNRRDYALRVIDRVYGGDLRGMDVLETADMVNAECPNRLRLSKK